MNTTISPPQADTVTLHYREGSSDKIYQVAIEPRGELFVVTFAFGRRGSSLNTGIKTSSPVDYETAKNTYDKLVREKMVKGYTPGENGVPYHHSDKAERVTGILPQLLNPIDYMEAQRLLKNPVWCLQEKFDGKRMLIQKQDESITAINRKGLAVGLPSTITIDTQKLTGDFILDGECIGQDYYAFDLLELNGENHRSKSYQHRLVSLSGILNVPGLLHIEFVETVTDTANKQRLFKLLQDEKSEGAVFKRLDAAYTPGRPASGGCALKCKFYSTASCVVAKINAQRSVELRLLNGEGWVSVGNVTIPPNHPLPKVGSIIECRYLYAFPQSKSLYQPIFLGERKDIESHECVMSQLKFKAEDEEA
jgi:bifunctional non-homologous end joining protein LigD